MQGRVLSQMIWLINKELKFIFVWQFNCWQYLRPTCLMGWSWQLHHEKNKRVSFCFPYCLSIWQNISFQNSRWPNPYPALSLTPELPTVPALTLLWWREVCPLRGQVSPGIILVNSEITFPSIGHSQVARNYLGVYLSHTKLLLGSGLCVFNQQLCFILALELIWCLHFLLHAL